VAEGGIEDEHEDDDENDSAGMPWGTGPVNPGGKPVRPGGRECWSVGEWWIERRGTGCWILDTFYRGNRGVFRDGTSVDRSGIVNRLLARHGQCLSFPGRECK